MTRRWLSCTTLGLLPAVVISLSVPAVALAQPQNPPPPAISAQQPPPPIVQSTVERPMRFILTGGTVVIGTRTTEDAEFFTVNTATGLVRIRKADVASMDYNVTSGTQAPAVAQAPVMPPPTFSYAATRPSRPGRGLLIAGTIIFSISYGLTVFGATIAMADNSDAALLFLPVAGPLLFAAVDEAPNETVALFVNLTIIQAVGLFMLILGAAKASSAPDPAQARMPNQFRIGQAEMRLDPVASQRMQGLALSGQF